jgi:hypothetical protein
VSPTTWPAITVRQPEAWTVQHGHQPVISRTWCTSYRGPLVLHSDSRFAPAGAANVLRHLPPEQWPATGEVEAAPRGYLLAVLTLDRICQAGDRCDCGPWAVDGQYHWRVTNPRPLAEPIPATGSPAWWLADPRHHAALAAALLNETVPAAPDPARPPATSGITR